MTKQDCLKPYAAQPDLRLLLARVLDKQALCAAREIPTASVFLSPEEQVEAARLLGRLPGVNFAFCGGYAEAERKLCLFLPDYLTASDWVSSDDGPLCALTATVPPMAELTHRDYLGALMGLGLSREKCGDILPTRQGAQIILLRETGQLVERQWESVGRYPVRLAPLPLADLAAPQTQVQRIRDTVSSLRLDSVIAAGFSLSRTRATELIRGGRILRNHRPCDKSDQAVGEGDVFSCRGMGKFVLRSAAGKSKKGRIILEIQRYV